MELYGGGMLGKSNNYQLGGRIPKYPLGGQIAGSRRGREYKVELEGLRQKAERDAERKGFLGKVGSLARVGGNLIVPGLGDVFKTGIESTYKSKDYSGGKYAKNLRDDLTQQSEDFKSSVLERGLVGGLQTALMPEVYSGLKKELGKGAEWLKGLRGSEASATAAQAADIAGAAPEFAAGYGTAPVHEGMTASGLGLSGPPQLGAAPSMAMQDFGSSMAGKLSTIPSEVSSFSPEMLGNQAMSSFGDTSLGDFSSAGLPSQFASANDLMAQSGYYGPPSPQYLNRQGGMIPMMPAGGLISEENLNPGQPPSPTPPLSPMAGTASGNQTNQYGVNLGALQGLTDSGFNMGNVTGGALFGKGAGLSNIVSNPVGALGSGITGAGTTGAGTTGAGTTGAGTTGTGTTGGSDPSGTYSGYGTAIDPMAALGQMGMGDVANDPRLQEYLKDLPQFSQGYQQQFGDVQSGGRQALSQMYANQRNMGGGFAGAGAGAQAFGQQYGGLMGDQARQRRGVVEGFQSDLLSSISDIEDKAGFTFGQGSGGDSQVESEIQNLMNTTGMTRAEAERQIYQDTQGGSGGTRS